MADLEVRDVTSGYGELQILWGVSLALEPGRLTALVGSNGAGKTTLLRTIMGLIRPWQGQVRFRGQDVSRLPAHEKAEMGLVLAPEGRQLFTDMSVVENLEMGATPQRARPRAARNLARVYEMFPRLKERARQQAGTLSGGEQQMLAVARGIMADPAVLMVDEMSLGLAPLLAMELFGALRGLRREGLTILLVEQNIQMALRVSDDAYVLSEGRVQLHGPAAEVYRNAEVRRGYLGVEGRAVWGESRASCRDLVPAFSRATRKRAHSSHAPAIYPRIIPPSPHTPPPAPGGTAACRAGSSARERATDRRGCPSPRSGHPRSSGCGRRA